MRHLKYLDEIDEDTLRKDLIYVCEESLPEVEPEDDEETVELLDHEKRFNHLSTHNGTD